MNLEHATNGIAPVPRRKSMLSIEEVVRKVGPFQFGFAVLVVNHNGATGMLNRITSHLREVDIVVDHTEPDPGKPGKARTILKLEAAPFTAHQEDVCHKINAEPGVDTVDVIFTG